MRLQIRLPKVKPGEYQLPAQCPYEGCEGENYKAHQQNCKKPIADTDYGEVNARRYECLRCKRTFRVYPQGVSSAQRSDRLRGIGVMLYTLGLSYGGTADVLEALGWPGSKSSVYRDVQAAGEAVQRLRATHTERQVQVLGVDTTFVTCNRASVTIGIGVDALVGDVLTIEVVETESTEALQPFIDELIEVFEVEVLLSDDQDTYKTIADEKAVLHSICRAHVNRNVARLVGELGTRALNQPDPKPPGVSGSLDQFLADIEYFQWLVALRPTDGADQLRRLHQRYQSAPAPREGEKATMWYRFRLALLKWWENWERLTLDRVWANQAGHRPLDGTNNVTERAIGWWIKERYRTMRTYKRLRSVINVCHLITYLGAHSGQLDMAEVFAA